MAASPVSEPLRPLLRLWSPLLILVLSVFSLTKADLLDNNYMVLLGFLPYVLILLTLALAHYFNRSRFFAAALLLGSSYWIIQNYLQTSLSEQPALTIYTALSLLAPLALLLLMVLPERGLWNSHSLPPLLLIPVLLLLAYSTYHYLGADKLAAINQYFAIKPYRGYVLSLAASYWFALSLVGGLLLLSRRDAEAEASLITCLLCIYVTLAFFKQSLISNVMFSAASIALLIGLLRSSFEMAYRDDLTGLLGRRAFNEKLRGLGRGYVIAMLDVDHFKKFNDRHGHDVGDDVLKMVASHIDEVGGGGTAYRYGGEEFSIVFPGKSLKKCIPHLEAVREAIGDHDMILRDNSTRPKDQKEGAGKRSSPRKSKSSKSSPQKTVSVTISSGVAERNERFYKPDQVLKAADKALYKAKKNGRNCLAEMAAG